MRDAQRIVAKFCRRLRALADVLLLQQLDLTEHPSLFLRRSDTKDPGALGKQHHCCTSKEPKYCPTAKFLGAISDLEVWAEGVEGDFHIELDWIGASKTL